MINQFPDTDRKKKPRNCGILIHGEGMRIAKHSMVDERIDKERAMAARRIQIDSISNEQ